MFGGCCEYLGEVCSVGIDGTSHERAPSPQRHRQRVKRGVNRPHWRRLRDLASLRGGGVLAFCQSVDPVVKHEDRQVDVASHGVDEVVAAYGQGVAVAGDDEHGQVRARDCDSCRDGRCAAMDGVHAVGAHVVREA